VPGNRFIKYVPWGEIAFRGFRPHSFKGSLNLSMVLESLILKLDFC
jgi:hypothetical protein